MKQFIRILLLPLILSSPACKKAQLNETKNEKSTEINIIKEENDNEFMRNLAKEELEGFLKDTTKNLLRGKILIDDKEELVQLTEPILFNIYGKAKIISERPYEVYLFGDFWYMTGTLRNSSEGGTFSIAINKKTCEIVGISHGK